MTRWLSAAALAAVIASPVQAIEWPWQQEKEARYGYCKGFVVAGLAEFPVQDLSRTNLWLGFCTMCTGREIPDSLWSFCMGSAKRLSAGIHLMRSNQHRVCGSCCQTC